MKIAFKRQHNSIIGAGLLIALFLWVTAEGCRAADNDPLGQTKQTVDGILEVLSDAALTGTQHHQEKQRRIMALIDHRFNFRDMSRLTLGSQWKSLNKEDQEQFVRLFSNLLKKTYMIKIESFSGEKIEFFKQFTRGDKAMVMSKIIGNGSELPVIYKLRSQKAEWKVYDVVIEGVSLVKNYRNQFASILERESVQGLMARLEDKVLGNGEG